MNKAEIEGMLDQIGIPYRLHHFENDEAIDPPFMVYVTRKRPFAADGMSYVQIMELDIELYTDSKDGSMEERIEQVMDANGIRYKKTEGYLEDENMYEVLYETEV